MSYHVVLQGLGDISMSQLAPPTLTVNPALFTKAAPTITYKSPELAGRTITCTGGNVLDASGTACVSPGRCSEGSLLNVKTGECVYQAAPAKVVNLSSGIRTMVRTPASSSDALAPAAVAACASNGGIPMPDGSCVPAGTSVAAPEPDHTALYVGIAALAAVGLTAAFFAMKKRKADLCTSPICLTSVRTMLRSTRP